MIGLTHGMARRAQPAHADAYRSRHGIRHRVHQRLRFGLPVSAGAVAHHKGDDRIVKQDGHGGNIHVRNDANDVVELSLREDPLVRCLHGHDIIGLKRQLHFREHAAYALPVLRRIGEKQRQLRTPPQCVHLLLRHVHSPLPQRGIHRPAHAVYQLVAVDGLEQVIEDRQLDRAAGILELIVTRNNDHLAVRQGLPDRFDHFQAVAFGHAYVCEDDIGLCVQDQTAPCLAVESGPGDLAAKGFPFDRFHKRTYGDRVILNDNDFQQHGTLPVSDPWKAPWPSRQ